MRVAPYQVKSGGTVRGGVFRVQFPASTIHDHEGAYVVLAPLLAPEFTAPERYFVIDNRAFRERCPRWTMGSTEYFLFEAALDPTIIGPWREFIVAADDLRQRWLERIPSWNDPLPSPPPAHSRRMELIGDRRSNYSLSNYGHLWTAAQLEFAGRPDVVVAGDRVKQDAVDLLVHHIGRRAVCGLHVKTGTVTPEGTVQFAITQSGFFVDDRLFVLLIPCDPADGVANECLLLPSTAVPELFGGGTSGGRVVYHVTITLDPLTERFRPYRVARGELGRRLLERIFPPEPASSR
jgi:hypothetical protein